MRTMLSMKKYNFVYKTTNDLNDDYYYGVHTTDDLDDGYLGSGKRLKRAINKYGESNFTREIVQYFSDLNNAYRLEAAIVTPELVADPHCYNLVCGGRGRCKEYGLTEHGRKQIIKSNQNRYVSKETREKKRKSMLGKNKGKKNPLVSQKLKGRIKSEEHKQHMKGPKSPEHCKHIGDVNRNTKYMNNGITNKRVKIHDIDSYLNNGWSLGYLTK